jgi:hypothetical protein
MSENAVMNIYYTNRTVLFCMCAGNEAFYAALYLLYFTEGPVCKYNCILLIYANLLRQLIIQNVIVFIFKIFVKH